MKEEQEKNLDNLIRKVIKVAGTEEPPSGFTDSVMEQIQSIHESEYKLTYSPLVTKRTWILIAIGVLGLCAYLLTNESQLSFSTNWLPFSEYLPDFGSLVVWEKINLDRLGNIKIHSSVIYAALMLPVFFYIQIFYLQKKHA